MPTARKLQTNFSKGELSPRMEGRPDLAAYFDGAKTLTNWMLLRQGGATRWPGTRYIDEVKDSTKDTILIPFIFSVSTSYMLEFGDQYIRVFTHLKAPVLVSGIPLEIITPYLVTDLRNIHFRQSADVLYLWCDGYQVRKLSRTSDTDWTLTTVEGDPPPTEEADTTFSSALVYSHATGTARHVYTDGDTWLDADVGRLVIIKAGKARIVSRVDARHITIDVIDPLPSNVITSGPGVLSTIGTAVTTTVNHGLSVGQWISIQSGAQLGECRRVDAVLSPTTATIASAFSADQNGVDWSSHTITPSGQWALRTSPQTTLDPTAREPIGGTVTCRTLLDAFRTDDIGKYLLVFGGIIQITALVSAKEVTGIVMAVLTEISRIPPENGLGNLDATGTNFDISVAHALIPGDRLVPTSGSSIGVPRIVATVPTSTTGTVQSAWPTNFTNESWKKYSAAPSGAWSLEVKGWSAARGCPRTGGFYEGRLGHGGTVVSPTSFWLSESDGFEGFTKGVKADNAIHHTISSNQVNRIEWMVDAGDLLIGTTGSEYRIVGEHNGEPLGGDIIPLVKRLSGHGSAPIQPLSLDDGVLFVDRSRKKMLLLSYALEQDKISATDVTRFADHIVGTGLALGPIVHRSRIEPLSLMVRNDGILIGGILDLSEKFLAWMRRITDGLFQAVAVLPGLPGESDTIWTIVQRTINAQTKRYIEVFEENAPEMLDRAWTAFYTDCAKAYSGAAITTVTGAGHLEGETVDVIADGSYVGQKIVSGGQFTLEEPATQIEYGLPIQNVKIVTMRPAIEGAMIEGLPRKWNNIGIRLLDTRGGIVNGEWLAYTPDDLDKTGLFSGDRFIVGQGWNRDGNITIEQPQPYPMTVLCVYGELAVGDHV